jgi:outer membrane receptor protein involved in Fe transport
LDDKAAGVFYQDVSVSRRLGKLVLMAGVDNVADVRPPLLLDGETNTDTATYDVVGRFVWGKVSYDF